MNSDISSIAAFRAATENQSALAGVMNPSFRCPACKQTRLMAGRKQRVKGSPKFGFICGECAAKRDAKEKEKSK